MDNAFSVQRRESYAVFLTCNLSLISVLNFVNPNSGIKNLIHFRVAKLINVIVDF